MAITIFAPRGEWGRLRARDTGGRPSRCFTISKSTTLRQWPPPKRASFLWEGNPRRLLVIRHHHLRRFTLIFLTTGLQSRRYCSAAWRILFGRSKRWFWSTLRCTGLCLQLLFSPRYRFGCVTVLALILGDAYEFARLGTTVVNLQMRPHSWLVVIGVPAEKNVASHAHFTSVADTLHLWFCSGWHIVPGGAFIFISSPPLLWLRRFSDRIVFRTSVTYEPPRIETLAAGCNPNDSRRQSIYL